MIDRVTLQAAGVGKTFNRRRVFENVSFSLATGQTILVTGRNGSGKSTLVKIVCGVLTPTSGTISFIDGEEKRRQSIGMVAPYLQLYEEFTARENLALAVSIRGQKPDHVAIDDLLGWVGLRSRIHDQVRGFSSGMRQRVKYALALIHRPPLLLLDEPMANLDADGLAMVRRVMNEQRNRGMLLVATNDPADCEQYDARVDLDELKKS